jgi:NADH:ubiquinone oxidoreductase subunit 2 (subunit N)
MALELNLIAFIPLLISPNKLASESALKYFFIQALGSIFIFFFILTSFFYSSYPLIFNFQFPFPLIINFALLLKLGAAPFHF